MPAQPTPARLEAFSDGVIAVIITIMVLELKVPHQPGLAGFLTILPTLAIYLLSFASTGIYWVNHHHLIHRLHHVTPLILWANLFLLFCLSLLPYFTSYLVDTHLEPFAIMLYIGSLLLTGIAFSILQKVVGLRLHRTAQFDSAEEALLQQGEQRKAFLSVVIYLTAIPAAFFLRPFVALMLAASVTLIWIIPTFGIRQPPATSSGLSS